MSIITRICMHIYIYIYIMHNEHPCDLLHFRVVSSGDGTVKCLTRPETALYQIQGLDRHTSFSFNSDVMAEAHERVHTCRFKG